MSTTILPGEQNSLPGELSRNSLPGELSRNSLPGEVNRNSLPGKLSRNSLPGELSRNSLPGELSRNSLPGELWGTAYLVNWTGTAYLVNWTGTAYLENYQEQPTWWTEQPGQWGPCRWQPGAFAWPGWGQPSNLDTAGWPGPQRPPPSSAALRLAATSRCSPVTRTKVGEWGGGAFLCVAMWA